MELVSLQTLVNEYGLVNLRFHLPLREKLTVPASPSLGLFACGDYKPLQEAHISRWEWARSGNQVRFDPVHEFEAHPETLYISDFEILLRTKPDEYKVSVLTTDGYSILTFPPF